MRESLFDGYCNYWYCSRCICHLLGVHKVKWAQLRHIKISQCQQTVIRMPKKVVVKKDFVLRRGLNTYPVDISVWLKCLKDTDDIAVEYPSEWHRLAGRPSNKTKPVARSAFLTFVDDNSHPNGHQAGSYSPQFFIPKFTRIDPPNPKKRTLIPRLQHLWCGLSITHKGRQVVIP